MAASRRLLFVGLGNHGYGGIRHNAGLMALDAIAMNWHFQWENSGICLGLIAQKTVEVELPIIKRKKKPLKADLIEGVLPASPLIEPELISPTVVAYDITLMKPKQLMNINGKSIAATVKAKRFSPDEVIVFHDDLEREVGALSWKLKGSANGHNGVLSAIGALRTQDFLRMRIGIGRPASRDQSAVSSYVLKSFLPSEQQLLYETLHNALIQKIKEKLIVLATPN